MPTEIVTNALRRIAFPSVLVLIALYGAFELSDTLALYQSIIKFAPYAALSIALLLALQFNRLRLSATALVCLAAYGVIHLHLQQPLDNPQAFYLYSAVSLLLPLNLVVIALLPEGGLRGPAATLAALFLAAQFGGLYWLYANPPILTEPYAAWLQVRQTSNYVLSSAGTLAFAFAAVALFGLLCWRNNETEAALFSCLLAAFATLVLFSQHLISSILFTISGLCLVYGVFRSSHDMAFRDDLTGLRNRRAFNDKMRSLGRRYVIATLDVDHFKKFNDTYGHDVGDDVLKLVASKISQVTGGGIPYRYGGEEFCVVFPGKESAQCVPHLEAVRLTIEGYQMAIRNQNRRPADHDAGKALRTKQPPKKTVSVTVSIGVAERSADLPAPEAVLKGSDEALYQAKKAGRNRLVVA